MELLILLVGVVVLALCAIALLNWLGFTVPPIVYQIGGYLLAGVVLVFLIKLLWPFLFGSLSFSLK